MDDLSLTPLVRGVKLLCLDAGNTVIFLDHARLAAWVSARGPQVSSETLVRAEGEAKLAQERGTMVDLDWDGRHLPGAIGWGRMVGTMLVRAGVSESSLRGWLPGLWAEHVRLNFWSVVPEGLVDALGAVRAAGGRVAIVSNSEGMLDGLFRQLGVREQLDLVLDSGVVGIEKPDPRIFRLALDRYALSPDEALHLGDSIATDVDGARAAGVRVALVDPFGHCAGRALDVPRVPGATEVARALAGAL
jgi:putative hydrolase of the HAD superfamily